MRVFKDERRKGWIFVERDHTRISMDRSALPADPDEARAELARLLEEAIGPHLPPIDPATGKPVPVARPPEPDSELDEGDELANLQVKVTALEARISALEAVT